MKKFNNTNKKFTYKYITNQNIRGLTFRLIDDKSKQIGIVSREEAFEFAQEHNVDLVLIAQNAQPPVVKAIDLNKHIYQEEKKNKEAKKGTKKGDTKDISLSLFIGEADFTRLVKKGIEFLQEGHQVRLKLMLKGREMTKQQMAKELIQKYISKLDNGKVSKEPTLQGRVYITIISKIQ